MKKDVVKKTEHDELVIKVNAIKTTDASHLLKETDYDTEISEVEKKLLIMTILIRILLHKNLTS